MVFKIEPWPYDDPESLASRYLVHTGKEPPLLVLEQILNSDPTSSPEVMEFILSDRSKYKELGSLNEETLAQMVDLPLFVRVDRSTFEPLERPPKVTSERWAFVQEVFGSLDKATRAKIQKDFRPYLETNEFRCTFLKHCLQDSKPVYYRFIFDQIEGASQFDWKNTHFHFEHKGVEYFVEDSYCIEPTCNCNGVLAMFHSRDVRTGAETDPFVAVLSIDGKLRALSRRTVPEEVAKDAVRAFLGSRTEGGAGKMASEALRDRWTDIREVGAKVSSRSFGRVARRGRYVCPLRRTEECAVKEQEVMSKDPKAAMAVGHFGRNDPCPCGSGKKYKRCCGAK